MKIKIKKLTPTAKLPVKSTEHSIGYDVFVDRMQVIDGALVYFLGIAVEPPAGHYLELWPRSSQTKYEWVLGNSIGLIDPDYMNELQMRFRPVGRIDINQYVDGYDRIFSTMPTYPFQPGERCGQLVIRKKIDASIEEVQELTDYKTRIGGFGSTGKD